MITRTCASAPSAWFCPAFECTFASVAPLLAAADGCLRYRLVPTLDSPDVYLLEVVWRDLAAPHARLRASDAHARFMAPLEPMLLGPSALWCRCPAGEPSWPEKLPRAPRLQGAEGSMQKHGLRGDTSGRSGERQPVRRLRSGARRCHTGDPEPPMRPWLAVARAPRPRARTRLPFTGAVSIGCQRIGAPGGGSTSFENLT